MLFYARGIVSKHDIWSVMELQTTSRTLFYARRIIYRTTRNLNGEKTRTKIYNCRSATCHPLLIKPPLTSIIQQTMSYNYPILYFIIPFLTKQSPSTISGNTVYS
jgi:hypothetical protein